MAEAMDRMSIRAERAQAGFSDLGRRRARRPAVLIGAALLMAGAGLAGCGEQKTEAVAEPRPVRTVVASNRAAGQSVSLTGQVEAVNEAAYGFRVGGRVIERLVDVGDRIVPGQVLARLDPQDEQNAVRSAQAAVNAAIANVSQTTNQYERQRQLLARGFTPRAQYEQAEQAMLNARSQLEDAEARLQLAHDRLSYTELKADTAGVVTQRRAEPGEVVQPGQAVVVAARQEGRDAVFEVPAQVLSALGGTNPEVQLALTGDPSVRATGRVREVAPQADPVTRTFRVRVGIIDAPASMRLGSSVTGSVVTDTGPVIQLPASALTRFNDKPAVWVVDPQTHQVALRNIDVLHFSSATVGVAEGLKPDEIVVTAGVQALHPGQKVRLLESRP